MKKIFVAMASIIMMSGCAMFSQDCDTVGLGGASDTVYFDYDSSKLNNDSVAVLTAKAEELKEGADKIVIQGHADERGTREYNIALGERRANAVKQFYISQGVEADRLATISYGKERPAVVGHDETAWSKNRRAITVAE